MGFTGIPDDAFDFFRELGLDNSKSFWRRHRDRHERVVRGPMADLVAELAPEFGELRMLRPQRDTRASHDKSPYKTYQGALVDLEPGLGFWLHLDASGLHATGRYYSRAPQETAAYRSVVAEDRGGELQSLVDGLETLGYTVGGATLQTRPRGIRADHPRVALLRHRTLDIGRSCDRTAAGLPSAAEWVALTWRELRPTLDWLSVHVCPVARALRRSETAR
ncbi:TIGR02453 family protein [Streptomyces hygroscopicus subsp. hygroscopicus]|nr:DUF2461 domain-containing protein [Streptomyces hygroscopicus]GLX47285.1 TIGR02453 family protein [Streptomyces hygroscopicus subsp. hygroscopicus]